MAYSQNLFTTLTKICTPAKKRERIFFLTGRFHCRVIECENIQNEYHGIQNEGENVPNGYHGTQNEGENVANWHQNGYNCTQNEANNLAFCIEKE